MFKEWIQKHYLEIILSVIILLFAILFIALLRILTNKINEKMNKRGKNLAKGVSLGLSILIFFLMLIFILIVWDYQISTVLIIIGALTVVFGLGAQKLIADFFASMGIVFGNLYEVDDTVEINGFKGKVVTVGMRTTQIINQKQERYIVANSDIKEIINYSRNNIIVDEKMTFPIEANIEKIADELDARLENAKEYVEIIEGPHVSGIEEITKTEITIKIIAKAKVENEDKVRQEIMKIKRQYMLEHREDNEC